MGVILKMTQKPRQGINSSEELRLAARLREAREYLGISQEAVSRQLDIPRASVSALESGKRRVSSIELQRLAALYKTPVNVLLGESDESDPLSEALFRTATGLSDQDRRQVLRFAEFLREAGPNNRTER